MSKSEFVCCPSCGFIELKSAALATVTPEVRCPRCRQHRLAEFVPHVLPPDRKKK